LAVRLALLGLVKVVVVEGHLCLLIHRMRYLFLHKGICIPIRRLVRQDPQAEEEAEIIDMPAIVTRELKVMITVTVMVMAIHILMDMHIILPTRVLGAE